GGMLWLRRTGEGNPWGGRRDFFQAKPPRRLAPRGVWGGRVPRRVASLVFFSEARRAPGRRDFRRAGSGTRLAAPVFPGWLRRGAAVGHPAPAGPRGTTPPHPAVPAACVRRAFRPRRRDGGVMARVGGWGDKWGANSE